MKYENATPRTAQKRQACHTFLSAISGGDLDRATACFTRDACLITPDATAIRGRERIRPVLAQLIARHTEIRVELSNILVSGDVALASEHWTIRCDGIEGTRFEQLSNPTLVLRQIDESWKLSIAALWGWDRLNPSGAARPVTT